MGWALVAETIGTLLAMADDLREYLARQGVPAIDLDATIQKARAKRNEQIAADRKSEWPDG